MASPPPSHTDDPVEDTVHAGCGLPLLAMAVTLGAGLIYLLN